MKFSQVRKDGSKKGEGFRAPATPNLRCSVGLKKKDYKDEAKSAERKDVTKK